nr:MAG TPA: hypothetical protein [Caudoviricetes sp.]
MNKHGEHSRKRSQKKGQDDRHRYFYPPLLRNLYATWFCS